MLTKFEIENKLHAIKPVLTDKFHVRSIGYFGHTPLDNKTNKATLTY